MTLIVFEVILLPGLTLKVIDCILIEISKMFISLRLFPTEHVCG
jgi:hypothetical protein